MNLDVELNLGLGSRRTNRDLSAILGVVLKHVAGSGHLHLGDLTSPYIEFLKTLVVLDSDHWRASDFLLRILAEVLHHCHNLLGATLALAYHRDAALLRVAISEVEVDEHLIHCHALVLSPSRNLAHERN